MFRPAVIVLQSIKTRVSVTFFVLLSSLLSCLFFLRLSAQENEANTSQQQQGSRQYVNIISEDPNDPENLLKEAQKEEKEKSVSLFLLPPYRRVHSFADRAKESLYDETRLKLGLAFNHLFQWLTRAAPKQDYWGTASDLDFVGTWELINRGTPYRGQVFFGVEGRWDYGTTGPSELGVDSLGSLIQTANAFAAYDPTFLLRNLYWQQGSKEAGWAYRIGKITPDAILSVSRDLNSTKTFLTKAGTELFSNALPDSGLGVAAVFAVAKNMYIGGLVSDANADRFNWGDIGAGDFYKAIELGVKIDPQTPDAGYSKLTVWHTDGTKDGTAINGMLGPEGWGLTLLYQRELSHDGKKIGILKWGKSFNRSAFYEQQAGAYFLLYDPFRINRNFDNLFGIAFNWAKSAEEETRNEYNLETFYRFPIFPFVDMTLSYQFLKYPAIDLGIDTASAFSLRLRSVF